MCCNPHCNTGQFSAANDTKQACLVILALLFSVRIVATVPIYSITHQSIVGKKQSIVIQPEDTLESLAQHYRVSYFDLLNANPKLDPHWALLPWQKLILPTQHILPAGKRQGIVINLPELKLYYFLSDRKVMIAPIGIGREGWLTPLGHTKVSMKIDHPSWTPTQRVRKDARMLGKILPPVVSPGPDNPLGNYAILLGWKSFLIHGTNRPDGVGKRSSAGCFRMYPEDIDFLYHHVSRNLPVRVLNQPIKTVWEHGQLWLQVYPDLPDYPSQSTPEKLLRRLQNMPNFDRSVIYWVQIEKMIHQRTGISAVVGEHFL